MRVFLASRTGVDAELPRRHAVRHAPTDDIDNTPALLNLGMTDILAAIARAKLGNDIAQRANVALAAALLRRHHIIGAKCGARVRASLNRRRERAGCGENREESGLSPHNASGLPARP